MIVRIRVDQHPALHDLVAKIDPTVEFGSAINEDLVRCRRLPQWFFDVDNRLAISHSRLKSRYSSPVPKVIAVMGTLLLVLKLSGIVLQGVSGGVALLVEFKDPTTKRITRWGRRALIGVILGTIISTSSFLLEQYIANQNIEQVSLSARRTMERLDTTVENSRTASTLSIESATQSKSAATSSQAVAKLASTQLGKTNAALVQLNRGLHSVDSMGLAFTFGIDLRQDEYLSTYRDRLDHDIDAAIAQDTIAVGLGILDWSAAAPRSGLLSNGGNSFEIFPNSGLFPNYEDDPVAWGAVHNYQFIFRFYKKSPVRLPEDPSAWDDITPPDLRVIFHYDVEDEKSLRLLYDNDKKYLVVASPVPVRRFRDSWMTNGNILSAPDFANVYVFLQEIGVHRTMKAATEDSPSFRLMIGNEFQLFAANFRPVKSLPAVYSYRFPSNAIGASYSQEKRKKELSARICLTTVSGFDYDTDHDTADQFCRRDVSTNGGKAPSEAELVFGAWQWTHFEKGDRVAQCVCSP